MAVHMEKISTHKKSKQGTKTIETTVKSVDLVQNKVTDKPVGGATIGTTIEGYGMYVFVYNKGSVNNPNKISETRHCSESQAKQYKEQLEKAGF